MVASGPLLSAARARPIGHPVAVVRRSNRTLVSFFAAIRARPGFKLKLGSIAALGLSVALRSGVLVAVAILVGSLVLGIAIGYPLYRRTGRVP